MAFPVELSQLGEVAIVAAALLGLVYAIKPLIAGFVQGQRQLADVNRELLNALKAADRSQDRNSDELRQMREASRAQTDALKAQTDAMAAALERHTNALTELVKSQSEATARITTAQDVAAAHTITSLTATIAKHDHDVMSGIMRIEAAIETLRTDVVEGRKAARHEILGKIDHVLAELQSMKPTPPPPKLVPLHPLEPTQQSA